MQLRYLSMLGTMFGLASFASASFEMMLIPDNVTNTIRRYDPQNNVSLGAYGTVSTRTDVALMNSTTSVSRLFSNSRFYGHDISTGEALYNSPSGFATNTNLLTRNGAVVYGALNTFKSYNFSTNTSSTIATFSSDIDICTIADGQDGFFYGYGRTISTGNLVALSVNTNTLVTTSNTFTTITSADRFMGTPALHISVTGSHLMSFVTRDVAGNNRVRTMAISGGTSSSLSAISITGFVAGSTSKINCLRSHDGFYVVGQDTAGTSMRIQAWDSANTPAMIGDQLITGYSVSASGHWAGAIVLAPEPGSMVALTLGIGALIGRRKSR